MPRIRTIKPSFFRSEDVSSLPLRARLTWIGLWTHCDDQGRTKDNARLIKGDVWPLDDVSLAEIEEDLETLAAQGRIVRYAVDGRRYLEVANWSEHQRIQKPSDSKIPPPPADYRNGHVVLPEGSDRTIPGKGKEGKGKEGDARARPRDAPPPPRPRCQRHAHLPDDDPGPDCRGCRDARLKAEHEAAEHAEADRLADIVRVRACPHCDAEGYAYEPGSHRPQVPYVRCDHEESP